GRCLQCQRHAPSCGKHLPQSVSGRRCPCKQRELLSYPFAFSSGGPTAPGPLIAPDKPYPVAKRPNPIVPADPCALAKFAPAPLGYKIGASASGTRRSRHAALSPGSNATTLVAPPEPKTCSLSSAS